MHRILKKIALPTFIFFVAQAVHAQDAVLSQTVTIKSLAMRYQIEAGEAAIGACAANQVHATVVIVDSAGNTRLQMVGDGGKYSFLEEARRKARTSAMMRQSTATLQKSLAANPAMRIPPDTDFLVIPGGVPIRAGSEVVGAIGVAGGEPQENDSCAQAGADKLKELLYPEESATTAPRPNTQPAETTK